MEELEAIAKKVGDQIIDLSAEHSSRMESWSKSPSRPNNLNSEECVGFINNETATGGLSLVVDVQAPANASKATLRAWAIESKSEKNVELFNNIQLTFEADYNQARQLTQKGGSATRDDIRTLLHSKTTKLEHVTVSNESGVDDKTRQKFGKRYELDVDELHEDLIPKVVNSIEEVAALLEESAGN